MARRALTAIRTSASENQNEDLSRSLVLVRGAKPESEELWNLLFRRYPAAEWATFARFGWRETPGGLICTLASLDTPSNGDLDDTVDHVSFAERYSLRAALSLEQHPLAVGVVHSHPQGFRTDPSTVDDDMDAYYAGYFGSFAPARPYISLIFARSREGGLSGTGRVWWNQRWYPVDRFAFESEEIPLVRHNDLRQAVRPTSLGPVARLASAFGDEAAERLARATVAVVGAGGTGSPALEVLARAGVGHIITVDPDQFEDSNLERVHGSTASDTDLLPDKVLLAKRHIASINPKCEVTAIRGAVPQQMVLDALVTADVAIGCTDQEHSRLALSDWAIRYLIPTIDVGVALEGGKGSVTGQIIQLVRFLPRDPCAYCQRMIRPQVVAQELMSQEERDARRIAAARADTASIANRYWQHQPALNTVGYLTTVGGALAAGYAIGLITQRFNPLFSKLQMDLSADVLDVTNQTTTSRPTCICGSARGTADQGSLNEFVSVPKHWKAAELLTGT